MDEKDALLSEEKSLINDEVLQAQNDKPSVVEGSHSRLPLRCITWFVIGLIVFVVIVYFSLKFDKMINDTEVSGNVSNVSKYFGANIIETIYLFLTVAVIIFFIIEFRRNFDSFFETTYNNYPMLIVMIICGLVDVGYYIIHFISVLSGDIRVDQLFVSLSELFFCVGILPFVIICVCYTARSENLRIKTQMVLTIVATMAGCFIIYIKRVCDKIERDRSNHTLISDHKYNFLYHKTKSASNFLELVDITFILIGLVFLIDPLLKLTRQEDRDKEDNYLNNPANNSSHSFITNISLIRYRWPTIVFSVAIVSVLLTESYIMSDIPASECLFKDNSRRTFFYTSIVVYVIAVFYCIIYYYWDISLWDKRRDIFIRNDRHFNNISSLIQIIYALSMSILCVTLFEKGTQKMLYLTHFLAFLLLAIQAIVQAMIINSAIRRHVTNNPVQCWQSQLFPAVTLASINASFMIISIIYSSNDTFISYASQVDLIIFIVLKNVACPITILNRLHGMAFFVNLSIKQWQEPRLM